MKFLRNENGAALIIVLGIIMLLMIFGTVLAAKMTQTQKQIDQTEAQIVARNLVLMGEKRVEIIKNKLSKQYQSNLEQGDVNSLDELRSGIQKQIPGTKRLDDNHEYVLSVDPNNIRYEAGTMTFEVEIKGTAYREIIEQIRGFEFTKLANQ